MFKWRLTPAIRSEQLILFFSSFTPAQVLQDPISSCLTLLSIFVTAAWSTFSWPTSVWWNASTNYWIILISRHKFSMSLLTSVTIWHCEIICANFSCFNKSTHIGFNIKLQNTDLVKMANKSISFAVKVRELYWLLQ